MESSIVQVTLKSMSICKWGASSLILMVLNSCPYSIDFNKLCDVLQDITLYNKFCRTDLYIAYVLSNAIPAPFIMKENSAYWKRQDEEIINAGNMRIFLTEAEYLTKLYKRIIDEATLNILDYKSIFGIVIKEEYDSIIKIYDGLEISELEHIPRFQKLLANFFKYHQFINFNVMLTPREDECFNIVITQKN